jgi:predicted DNA-binding transcriptional regulator YafY
MATTKNAQLRYNVLDRCFSNPGRKYAIKDLLEACNNALNDHYGGSISIQRRQLYDDISFMESLAGWSISLIKEKKERSVYYKYEDPDFSINKKPLNPREESQLREVLTTLSRFRGMPQFDWMEELTARLDASIGTTNRAENIIDFQQNPYLKGMTFFSKLYEAMQNKQSLEISYQSFKSDTPTTSIVHPYFLKQYNNRWFLFAKTEGYDTISNFALDRIVDIANASIPYVRNTEIDFSEYFEDILGVSFTANADPIDIQLWISNSLYPYVKTKPLHGSQKLKEQKKDGYIISLNLIPNYELQSILLSHGEKIKVLSPSSFREALATRINEMIKLYK